MILLLLSICITQMITAGCPIRWATTKNIWAIENMILLLLSIYTARMISAGSPIRRATTQNIWAIENTTTFFRW